MTSSNFGSVKPPSPTNNSSLRLPRRGFLFGAPVVLSGVRCAAAPRGDASAGAYPAWFARDLNRKAPWLPDAVKDLGLEAASAQRFLAFPQDIRANLVALNIPRWLIALVPTDVAKQYEIHKQLRYMTNLAGDEPGNRYAKRLEQLALFAGGAQIPTPGDEASGRGLADAGCAAAISHYLVAQLKLEFADLADLDERLTHSQSSAEMKRVFFESQKALFVGVRQVAFADLRRADFKAGSILIAEKPGGTHVMAWTRVPRDWKWDESDLMAVGNTGLQPFGNRMILAQDYVTSDSNLKGQNINELRHNAHGPINSGSLGPLSDPTTNIYAAKASRFFMVDFIDPAGQANAALRPSSDHFVDVPLPRSLGRINSTL